MNGDMAYQEMEQTIIEEFIKDCKKDGRMNDEQTYFACEDMGYNLSGDMQERLLPNA